MRLGFSYHFQKKGIIHPPDLVGDVIAGIVSLVFHPDVNYKFIPIYLRTNSFPGVINC